MLTCLKIVSDNCFEITGAASAGLPGLTIGEQIGGMWKSIAVNKTISRIGTQCTNMDKGRKLSKIICSRWW